MIFITAEDQTESVVAGFEAGGVDYIGKPFRDKEVLMRVRTHLLLQRQLIMVSRLSEENLETGTRVESRNGAGITNCPQCADGPHAEDVTQNRGV